MKNRKRQLQDELLVIKCQQNDSQAFEEIVQKWQKRLWAYAFRMIGSETSAYDIVQETWCGVIKGLNKLNDVSVFPSWIFRLLHNKCVDWIQNEQRETRLKKGLKKIEPEEPGQDMVDGGDTLQIAIERLSPERKALILLRFQEEMAIGQMAEILNLPEGTVKSRLHRTVMELRCLLEKDNNE
jgi:RNA polymerase sigma-70 factor (ECF subfamily)